MTFTYHSENRIPLAITTLVLKELLLDEVFFLYLYSMSEKLVQYWNLVGLAITAFALKYIV